MYTHVQKANDFMLLFQGIAEMAGREEKSRYELLEISDPSTLLVRGKDFILLYPSSQECMLYSHTLHVLKSLYSLNLPFVILTSAKYTPLIILVHVFIFCYIVHSHY